MNNFISSIINLNELELLANRDNTINRVNPAFKIICLLIYILFIVSGGKYNISRIIYLMAPLVVLAVVCEISFKIILKKITLPVLASLLIAIPNIIFDRDIYISFEFIQISNGFVSLFVVLLKSILTFSITIIFVSTTTVVKIGDGLIKLKVPKKIVSLLLLIYRYIFLLLQETSQTVDACLLRSKTNNGIPFSSWGSLVGQIFIRSYKRSTEIYQAMELRGLEV